MNPYIGIIGFVTLLVFLSLILYFQFRKEPFISKWGDNIEQVDISKLLLVDPYIRFIDGNIVIIDNDEKLKVYKEMLIYRYLKNEINEQQYKNLIDNYHSLNHEFEKSVIEINKDQNIE